jgi:hypothetical protein
MLWPSRAMLNPFPCYILLLQPMVSAGNVLYDMLWDEAALKSALGYGRADIM